MSSPPGSATSSRHSELKDQEPSRPGASEQEGSENWLSREEAQSNDNEMFDAYTRSVHQHDQTIGGLVLGFVNASARKSEFLEGLKSHLDTNGTTDKDVKSFIKTNASKAFTNYVLKQGTAYFPPCSASEVHTAATEILAIRAEQDSQSKSPTKDAADQIGSAVGDLTISGEEGH